MQKTPPAPTAGPFAIWPRHLGLRAFPFLQEIAGKPIETRTIAVSQAGFLRDPGGDRVEHIIPPGGLVPELACSNTANLEELVALVNGGLEVPDDADEARLELGARGASFGVVEAQAPLPDSPLVHRIVQFYDEPGQRPTIRAHVRRLDLAVALAEALAARQEDADAEAGREVPPLIEGWKLYCAADFAEVVEGLGRRRGYLRGTRAGEVVLVAELPGAVLADRWLLARRRRGVRK